METAVINETPKQEMIYIPADVRATLEKWADAERKRQENPLIQEMITWKSLGVKALREACKSSGHYVGKTTKGE